LRRTALANRVAGKVALVTGGARGQGAAHGELLAEEGASVILADVRDDLGEAHAASLRDRGAQVSYRHLDVSDAAQWDECVEFTETEHGLLNVLVNNAGIVSLAGAADENEKTWDEVIAVNQKGVWLGMKYAIPAMRRAGGGSIINTSSIWGVVGSEDYIAYQASKGAVTLMTKSAALTHAKEGIRVNSVVPGLVMTPMAEEEGEESNNAVIAMTPMGRGAEAREISFGVLFLASDEASFVTGSELVIDGGFLAQ
jgi:NAD(P)-dependent dehydrogenase (short-subunit alcohol dehydrogenase family)